MLYIYNFCRLYKFENIVFGSFFILLFLIFLEEVKEFVNNKVVCCVFIVIVNNKGVRFMFVD